MGNSRREMGQVTEHTEMLVQLPAACPECGKREARRVAAWVLRLYDKAGGDRVVESIICKCGTPYFIRASAYQEASKSHRWAA